MHRKCFECNNSFIQRAYWDDDDAVPLDYLACREFCYTTSTDKSGKAVHAACWIVRNEPGLCGEEAKLYIKKGRTEVRPLK